MPRSAFSIDIKESCHVVTFGASLAAAFPQGELWPEYIKHIINAPLPAKNGSTYSYARIREQLYNESWCVFAIVPAQRNIAFVTNIIEVVHNRRIIFLSPSSKISRRVQTKYVNCPSYILEGIGKLRRRARNKIYFHTICHNCFFRLQRKTNIWVQRKGFLLPAPNPFSKHCNKTIHFNSNFLTESCCFGKHELYGESVDVYIFGAIPYFIASINNATGEIETEGGVDIDVLTLLAKTLRFKPTGHGTNGWGKKDENGTWQGTIGKVSLSNTHIKHQAYINCT